MPPTADSLFKKLLKDLRPLFRREGFRVASQNFTLESDQCWAIINFQKSRWSNTDEKAFFVNVSVTAKRILAFYDQPLTKAPTYYSCDWSWRAEQFGPDKDIKQWTISDEKSAAKILTYLQTLFSDYVIPEVRILGEEQALIERSRTNPGYPQGKALSVLLAGTGRIGELKQVLGYLIENFGNGVVAKGVSDHLERMRERFPAQMRDIEGQ